MEQEPHIAFGPFRLETTPACLWRGADVIALRPRSLAVLRFLAMHPGRLVTKAELRQQVWQGTHVTDTVLRGCIWDIRAVLGDSAAAPQYLETVGRQGYRFLVPGDSSVPPSVASRPIVGRQGEVHALEECFQRAASGARQLVFVSGEAGIGKTTVLDLFLARLDAGATVRIGRSQCNEFYGEGEPYLSMLEALGRLSRGPQGPEILTVLRRYAPMWLVQLPGLVSDAELERVQRQVQGATRARMVRELAEALDVLTTERPLVLVLEDLHWSDSATVECLAALAQRREPARLLVLGTYRPVEAILQPHPLRGLVQELRGRGQCVELHLELLPTADVTAYMAGRLGGPVAEPFAAFVYERTGGNALFVVHLVEHLVQQALVVRQEGQWTLRVGVEAQGVSLPEGVQQVLRRRIEALPAAAQRVLEAASVVSQEVTAAAVAAGAQLAVEDVEVVCDGLVAQQHFLADIGLTVWPDGTSSGRYRFRHALYQQELYERLGSARRAQLHRRIGARLETGYGPRAAEIAAQLAGHFERGGDILRAVHYLQQAGDNAARRNAYDSALALLTKGLALLTTLPDSPERARQELPLQLALGELLMAAQGRLAPEVGEAYSRAQALCQQVGETPPLVRALLGLTQFYGARGQVRTASEMSQQLFHLVQRQPDPVLLLEGHVAMGRTAFYCCDFITSRAHLEHSLRLSDTLQSPTPTFRDGFLFRVTPRPWLAQVLWALGYADQAQQRSQEALALARQTGHTLSLMFAEIYAAVLSQCCRDVAATQAHAAAALADATLHGLELRIAQSSMLRGWALAMQGDAADGVAHLRRGLAVDHDVGPRVLRPYFLSLLVEAYGEVGQSEAALTVLAEALTLAASMEGHWWEAELYRLKGELLLRVPSPDISQVEACLHQALAMAHDQQARALELRAALSLSRLWQQQGKRQAARDVLAALYGWFTEGFDTADLQEASALLDELS